jgi:sugar/nucleoside kinase (ribokinase family)
MRLPVPAPPPSTRSFDAVALGLNATDNIVVVPRFPESGGKIEFVSQQILFGGQCASAMVALARLGLRTRYVGRVGSDDYGRMQLESIEREGVDCSECRVVEGVASQLAVIIVDETTGERTVLWRRDPRIEIPPDAVAPELVSAARAFLCDAHNIDAEVALATWAREAGVPVMVDVDADYDGGALYSLVDYLIASAEFPPLVTGIADPRASLAALQDRFGCALVATTLGPEGALALCEM